MLSALTKAVEKDETIAEIVVGVKFPSEAWKILTRMAEDDSSERVREQTKKNFEGLSMDNAESMKYYIARARSLALNVQYLVIEVIEQEIGRRVSNDLPTAYAPAKRNYTLKTDFSLSDLAGDLIRVEELYRSLGGTDGSHALAAGFKSRSGGKSGRSGGRWKPKWRRTRQAATVKFGHRISGSRSNSSISHGASKSSPHISRKNSSTSRGTSESSPRISSATRNTSNRSRNSSTSVISRDTSRSSPLSIRGDGVHHAFVSGVVSTGIFYPSGPHAAAGPAWTARSVRAVVDLFHRDHAILARLALPGKLRVPSARIVGNITVSGSYLHSTFIVQ